MIRISLGQLVRVLDGTLHEAADRELAVANVSIHSDRILSDCLFFALPGANTDGHRFVEAALRNHAVAAVVSRNWAEKNRQTMPGPLLIVNDPLRALQRLAAWCRGQFSGRVIGITGSSGKTMVKDILHHLLALSGHCAANPGSFNSQLGVPLSLLRAAHRSDYMLCEAGTSAPGEVASLERMIRPEFGILTNIGWAHIASFGSQERIADEMANLFRHIPSEGWVLAPADDPNVDRVLNGLSCQIHRFGAPSTTLPYIIDRHLTPSGVTLFLRLPTGEEVRLPVDSPLPGVVTALEIALCAASLLGGDLHAMAQALTHYTPPATRSEVWKSPNGVTVLNDVGGFDPLSIEAALRSLEAFGTESGRRLFVYGTAEQPGPAGEGTSVQVGKLAGRYGVDELLLLGGDSLNAAGTAFRQSRPHGATTLFPHVEAVREYLLSNLQWGDILLVKVPESRGVDRAALDLVEAMAPNRFYLDVKAVTENVARFRRLVGSHTRILAMVKALAYGSDAVQLSREFGEMGVDMIGVASADEGRQLRSAGIDLPILVMACTADEADKLLRHRLTPVVYNLEMVDPIAAAARVAGCKLDVHMEIDSGMGRLGIRPEQAVELAERIDRTRVLHLCGLMTHLSCADESEEDPFTQGQLAVFQGVVTELRRRGFSDLICHAAATAGAVRFPEARLDMVRIGLGLYGLYPSPQVQEGLELVPAVALVSRIVKISLHRRGERIGYGGTFTVPQDGFRAAVIPIGYHDGIPRALSNAGHILIYGQPAPICGRISMDSMVVDVTAIEGAAEGTDVLIYGDRGGFVLRPEEVAEKADTIAYELLARLGPRVQRIFLRE